MMKKKTFKDEIVVSIVCITYNHVGFIAQTLESLINQNLNVKFEILLYDDCSTDGTTKIVKQYANNYPELIKPIINEENKYAQDRHFSWEFCFSKAKGKYIAICEGDDYWTDMNKLEKQLEVMESDPTITLCYSSAFLHFNDDKEHSIKKVGRSFKDIEMFYRNPVPTLTVMFKKESLNGFWELVSPEKSDWIQSDYQVWLWLMNKGKVVYLEQPMAAYRVLNGSASRPVELKSQYKYRKSIINVSTFFAKKFLGESQKRSVYFRAHSFCFFWCYFRELKEMNEHKAYALASANWLEKIVFRVLTAQPSLMLAKFMVENFWWRKT